MFDICVTRYCLLKLRDCVNCVLSYDHNPIFIYQVLPILLQNCCPSFSLSQCKYKIERNRETTARITVWRAYGVKRSYTLETSYCGCDEGLYKVKYSRLLCLGSSNYRFLISTLRSRNRTKPLSNEVLSNDLNWFITAISDVIQGFHYGIKQLKEIGATFCMSLSSLNEETQKRANLPANNRLLTITTRYVTFNGSN